MSNDALVVACSPESDPCVMRVSAAFLWQEDSRMSTKRRKRHRPGQTVRKLRDADAMLNAGKELASVLQSLEVSEATYHCWRNQYGGMKAALNGVPSLSVLDGW